MKKANFKKIIKSSSFALKAKHQFFVIFFSPLSSSLYLSFFFKNKVLCVFKTKKLIKVRQQEEMQCSQKDSFYLCEIIIILYQMNGSITMFHKFLQCFSFYHIVSSSVYNNILLGIKRFKKQYSLSSLFLKNNYSREKSNSFIIC